MIKKTLLYIGTVILIIFGVQWVIRFQLESNGGVKDFDVEKYCNDEKVAAVYYCQEGYLRVVLKLLGGGVTYVKPDGTEIRCPVVGPDYVSEKCKELKKMDCGQEVCKKE